MGPAPKKRKRSGNSSPERPLRRSARLSGEWSSSRFGLDDDQTKAQPQASTSVEQQEAGKGDETTYDMELAVTPPQQIAAGRTLEAPLVVTFRNSKPRSELLRLAPPQKDLLRGRTADSIHPLITDDAEKEQPFAYVTFPDLAITRPGRYCFKVNIIDMNQPLTQEATSSSAKVLPALHSDVFDVVESERHSGQDVRISETINHLRAIGADL